MPALNIRISGFLILGEMGRTRPQLGGQGGPASRAGLGAFGKAATIAGQVGDVESTADVTKFLPSKFKESRTTLLKASMVISAAEALNSVPFLTSQVKPRRGCQLFLSEEQAGMI